MEQNNRTIAKNTIILAIQQILSLVVALYSSRVVLQSLGVEDFGVYNVVAGFVTMFSFLNTAMNNATQRFYNYEYGKNGEVGARKVFNNAFVIQSILSIVALLLLETVGVWYIDNRLIIPTVRLDTAFWVFQFSAISLLFVIMQIPYSAAIMAHEKMLCFASVNILDSILKLIIAIIIQYVDGDKLLLYSFLLLLVSVLDFIIYAIYAKCKFTEIVLSKLKDWSYLKQMLTFSGWNFLGSFAGIAKEQGVNLILNSFFGPIVNASRGIAYQVAGALKSFVSTVTISGRPQLMQSYAQGNLVRTFQLMYSMSKVSFLILLLFAVPVMFEIEYILKIWLSTEIPAYTGIFVNLVIVMSLVEAFSPPVSFVVHAAGKMAMYQIVNSIIIILILPVSYMVLNMGADAKSVFELGIIFQTLCQLSSLIILKRIVKYSIRDYVKNVILPLVFVVFISTSIVWLIKGLMDEGLLRLICVTFISTISIVLSSFFIVLDKGEAIALKAEINKFIKK